MHVWILYYIMLGTYASCKVLSKPHISTHLLLGRSLMVTADWSIWADFALEDPQPIPPTSGQVGSLSLSAPPSWLCGMFATHRKALYFAGLFIVNDQSIYMYSTSCMIDGFISIKLHSTHTHTRVHAHAVKITHANTGDEMMSYLWSKLSRTPSTLLSAVRVGSRFHNNPGS